MERTAHVRMACRHATARILPLISQAVGQPKTNGTRCDMMGVMKYFSWNDEKNASLIRERGISFEEIVFHIENGDVLDLLEHPKQDRYPNQRLFVVNVDGYAYLVPFVEDEQEVFLKTIIPSRKATRDYLGG